MAAATPWAAASAQIGPPTSRTSGHQATRSRCLCAHAHVGGTSALPMELPHHMVTKESQVIARDASSGSSEKIKESSVGRTLKMRESLPCVGVWATARAGAVQPVDFGQMWTQVAKLDPHRDEIQI